MFSLHLPELPKWRLSWIQITASARRQRHASTSAMAKLAAGVILGRADELATVTKTADYCFKADKRSLGACQARASLRTGQARSCYLAGQPMKSSEAFRMNCREQRETDRPRRRSRNPRSTRLRNPGQLRRDERYSQNARLKGESELDADTGSNLNAD
jgi:hypothetical protein